MPPAEHRLATRDLSPKKQMSDAQGQLSSTDRAHPHDTRLRCAWCKARGYPDGRAGEGWSASYRKSYLSAIKFLYHHFQADEDLPNHNPAVQEASPKVINKLGYVLSREEVKQLLDAPGSPKARLIVHWIFYAPSRRKTFADA